MQKSVNKLMYYPLRDDIPKGNLLMSKARPMTNTPSLRGLNECATHINKQQLPPTK